MTSPIELDDLECEFKEEVLDKVPDALLDRCMTCGTCTVLLDGKAVYSCHMLARSLKYSKA